MKLFTVFAFLSLITLVRGWVAYLQPVLFSIGALLTAFNQEIELPIIPPIKGPTPRWPVPEG